MNGMMLHCGTAAATLDQVMAATPPPPTKTWHPIAYGDFVTTVKESLDAVGIGVLEESYGLWAEHGDPGAMFFGLLGLDRGKDEEYNLTIGLRASYNQRFANGLVAGSRVFVCDNLSFSGEVRINRKNTRWAYRDLIRMVMEAMGKIGDMWLTQEQRYEAYKAFSLTDAQVHDILVRSLDAKVFANSYISKVLREWREPRHEEFAPRNAWSLFNSYTEVFKDTNPMSVPDRTVRLHGLLDSVVAATESRHAVQELYVGC